MAADRMTEISFEVPADEVSVLDGYCNAHGIKRTAVFRRILREWSEKKHHEASVIVRVAGSKPAASDVDRDDMGALLHRLDRA
jgi:hypothetical protein